MTAETDKAALRERHDEVTVEMIAAAWEVVRERYPNGRVLGPGPGFREAIEAALALRPLCDLEVRIVEAETEAEVDREFAEASRQQTIVANARADRLAAKVEALRAALKPFADEAARYDPPEGEDDKSTLFDCVRSPLRLRHLRAARTALARAADKPGERTDG